MLLHASLLNGVLIQNNYLGALLLMQVPQVSKCHGTGLKMLNSHNKKAVKKLAVWAEVPFYQSPEIIASGTDKGVFNLNILFLLSI